MSSGGKREGAGRKPGSVKPLTEKRVVRKLYQWTPDEYDRIQQAVKASGMMESKIVQLATMKEVEIILNESNGEQAFAADVKGRE